MKIILERRTGDNISGYWLYPGLKFEDAIMVDGQPFWCLVVPKCYWQILTKRIKQREGASTSYVRRGR